MIDVASTMVTVGVAVGRIRDTREVPRLRITRSPVRVVDYRACVGAGACGVPALRTAPCAGGVGEGTRATYAAEHDHDDMAVTCVTPKQAREYCAWVGGRLPNAEEWLVAARGDGIRRYAWGNEPPRCDHHPRALTNGQSGGECCGTECNTLAPYRVGAHSLNVAPSGMQDVLLTEGELIGLEATSSLSTCTGTAGACVARGMEAAAIDGFVAIPEDPGPDDYKGYVPDYSFRCVSEVSR